MGWMEAPKAVQQLQRGDPGKSELPGDWTAASLGKETEKGSAGHRTKTAISSPSSGSSRALARISSRGKKKKNIAEMAHRDSTPPRFLRFLFGRSLPRDGRAALISGLAHSSFSSEQLFLGIFMGITLPAP